VKYAHTRFRWEANLDMDALEERVSREFQVSRREYPGSEEEIALFKNERTELVVKADRLVAHMNARRANLTQVEEGAFTARDMALRTLVFEHYPHSRPSPFPWSFSVEPKFQAENGEEG